MLGSYGRWLLPLCCRPDEANGSRWAVWSCSGGTGRPRASGRWRLPTARDGATPRRRVQTRVDRRHSSWLGTRPLGGRHPTPPGRDRSGVVPGCRNAGRYVDHRCPEQPQRKSFRNDPNRHRCPHERATARPVGRLVGQKPGWAGQGAPALVHAARRWRQLRFRSFGALLPNYRRELKEVR
jgi:hypothetical protein